MQTGRATADGPTGVGDKRIKEQMYRHKGHLAFLTWA